MNKPNPTTLALLALMVASFVGTAQSARAADKLATDRLQTLIDGPQRSDKNRVRDEYRHPREVLEFFGVTPDETVVEILPGAGGYWTEILAPYLKDRGRYVAANGEKDSPSPETQKDNAGFAAKLAADPGSADVVLTFRNVHNWMADGETAQAFAAFFRALKPGGVLGVEEHRGRTDQPQDPKAASGYVRPDVIVGFAEAAGFRFEGSSEVNSNPRDTKDYPVGVWALPPTYRLKDVDRAKYAAIGESDRAVLKFVKP